MECNKDEAIRARELAERKMQDSDFAGAKKLALKAQQLYANLESISMILAVCEVHCSAQNKINGLDANWYDVLQVETLADEAIIKKQYRKLALLLHPDKNKFAGAEAAFKLIGEANRVLSDKMARSAFDLKVKSFMKSSTLKSKPPFQASTGSSSINRHQNTQHSVNKFVNQQSMANGPQHKSRTFEYAPERIWTRCPHCRTSFECFQYLLGRQTFCRTCRTSFIIDKSEAPVNCSNISSSHPESFGSKGIYGSFNMVHEAVGRATENNGGSDEHSVGNSMPAPPTKAGFSANNSKKKGNDVGGVSLNLNAQKKGQESGLKKPAMAKASRTRSKKRARPGIVESSESSDEVWDGDGDVETEVNQANGNSKMEGNHGARRSYRPKRNVSYTESLYDEGEFNRSPKMPETMPSDKEAHIDKGLKNDEGIAFSTPINGVENDTKQNNGTSHEANLSNKKRKLKKQRDSNSLEDEEVGEFEESDSDSETDAAPVSYECPDPQFSDFDKDKEKNCFDVDQIWAAYDTDDCMPRFYARVRRVFPNDFKLQITWLEPVVNGDSYTKWVDEGLPAACGSFRYGSTEITTELPMFSHQMCFELGNKRSSFVIYPRAGETWALFKNWDISWANEPEKHKPYKFEFIVILSDFDEKDGIKVAYLKKLTGFVSLFQRVSEEQAPSFQIPPSNLFQFSHRVPSFQMSGTERNDVPEGSYELDPASLPENIDEVVDFTDGELMNERKDTTGDISCEQSTENHENLSAAVGRGETYGASKKHCLDDENQNLTDLKSSEISPKEGQSYHESGTAVSNQDNDCIEITPRKQSSVTRRSPRGLVNQNKSNPTVT